MASSFAAIRLASINSSFGALVMTDDILPNENIPYLTALGRFTQRWSFTEKALDICNLVLFYRGGGKEINPTVPRTALEMKVSFFRECHLQLPDVVKERGLKVADEFSRLRDMRHALIHGTTFSLEADGAFDISRFRILKNELRIDETRFSLSQLSTMNTETWELGKSTLTQSALLIKMFMTPDEMKEALGEISG